MSQNPLKQSHTKRKIRQIKILSPSPMKTWCMLPSREDPVWHVYKLLMEVSQEQEYFFFFLQTICLQLGWTQRANSFLESISFETCLFQNKNSYWKHVHELFQSNWSQQPGLSKLQRSPQEIERWRESAGFSKSSGSPGSAEDTELKWWGRLRSPHCWVLGPEMHMFKKEVILSSSFSAAKGRGSGEISGSRPLIRLLIWACDPGELAWIMLTMQKFTTTR